MERRQLLGGIGALAATALTVGTAYAQNTKGAAKAAAPAARLFEPVMMALLGLVIGGIVILLYMPIFDLAGTVQ